MCNLGPKLPGFSMFGVNPAAAQQVRDSLNVSGVPAAVGPTPPAGFSAMNNMPTMPAPERAPVMPTMPAPEARPPIESIPRIPDMGNAPKGYTDPAADKERAQKASSILGQVNAAAPASVNAPTPPAFGGQPVDHSLSDDQRFAAGLRDAVAGSLSAPGVISPTPPAGNNAAAFQAPAAPAAGPKPAPKGSPVQSVADAAAAAYRPGNRGVSMGRVVQ